MARGTYQELRQAVDVEAAEGSGGSRQSSTGRGYDDEYYGALHITTGAYGTFELIRHSAHASQLSAEDLLRYIEAKTGGQRASQICLELKVYRDAGARTTNEEPNVHLSIPLPDVSPAARTLYCRADDSPCLRGGRMANDDMVGRDRTLRNLSKPWGLQPKEGEQLGVVVAGGPSRTIRLADKIAESRWATRVDRALSAPWKSLSERPTSDRDAEQAAKEEPYTADGYAAVAQWPSEENRTLALCALNDFIKDNAAATKYLICPASCYGWDLHALEEMITSDLQGTRPTGVGRVFHDVFVSMTNEPRVAKVAFKAQRPALCARRIRTKKLESTLFRLPFLGHPDSIPMAIVCAIVPSFTIAVIFFVTASSKYVSLFLGILPITALVVAAIALLVAAMKLTSTNGTVHETIGVACALKRWVAVPKDRQIISREEALAAVSGAIDVQRIGKSWYALIGTREEEWWAENRVAILTAIKQGRQGTLFIDEMHDSFLHKPRRSTERVAEQGQEASSSSSGSSAEGSLSRLQGALPAYDEIPEEPLYKE